MRIVALLMLAGAACRTASNPDRDAFGIWKVNPVRSSDPGSSNLTVWFGPHSRGEVFTMDKTGSDGRFTTSSTILFLDSKPRDFQGPGCSGTQSSRRVDSRTVEILRQCASGEWTRFVRQVAAPKELVLEITEQKPDGRRFERRLVLERQSGAL